MIEPHPASVEPLDVRVDYARIIAGLAMADDDIADEELQTLQELCDSLLLPENATNGVLLFAQSPDDDRMSTSLDSMRDSNLRYDLIADLVAIAMCDGKYEIEERRRIHHTAAMLLISNADLHAIEDRIAEDLEGGQVVTMPDAALGPGPARQAAAELLAGATALFAPAGLIAWGAEGSWPT